MAENNKITDKNDLPEGMERTAKGTRFAKGNKLGKGNPFNKKMNQFRAALYAEVKNGDIKKIARKIIDEACTGSYPHAKLALEYLMPAAPKVIDATINQLTPEEVLSRIDDLLGIKEEPEKNDTK